MGNEQKPVMLKFAVILSHPYTLPPSLRRYRLDILWFYTTSLLCYSRLMKGFQTLKQKRATIFGILLVTVFISLLEDGDAVM